MITIIDYGVGNIKAFVNIYKQLNIPAQVAQNADDLSGAEKLILPGVGAFDHAMIKLTNSGMLETVNRMVKHEKVPVLGICVGMQMLASRSDEGELSGLGWIEGEVKKFDVAMMKFETHLPHMGWNDVKAVNNNVLLNKLDNDTRFYFLHSYYFEAFDEKDIIATSDYGINFTCAVNHENVYGVQFHPEKSHRWGIQLLHNFSLL